MSLSLMVVCSVSTVVFNGNPLMRYDGYYVLADWLEIPNLRDRANRFLKTLTLEYCLGVEVRPEPYMALGRRIWFVTFAVLSYIYRWVVTFSILWFISKVLEPYKLGAISRLLAVAAAASLVGWPLYRLGESLYKRGRLPDMKRGRVWASVIVVAAFLMFVFLVPLPVSRVRDLALVDMEPQAMQKVFVKEPGTLEVIRVRDGQRVQKGDILAEFRNVDVDNEIGETESEIRIRMVQQNELGERLRSTSDHQERAKMMLEQAHVKGELDDYRNRLKVYKERHLNMILTAPCDGVVMGAPHQDDLGKFWEKEQQGTPFCTIGDPAHLRAIMPVSPADYRLLREDLGDASKPLPATIRIQGSADRTWKGLVASLPESEAKEVPAQLTARLGGPLATKPSSNPDVHVPQNQQYLVNVDFVKSDPSMCPGTMAQVKVHCRWQTCAWWLWRKITGTFDLRLM
jgi:putative peptide zinc metalloprotease protein